MFRKISAIALCLVVVALTACKSDEEKKAEEIRQQEVKEVSRKSRSADSWKAPDMLKSSNNKGQ